jgi:hypothetical protein
VKEGEILERGLKRALTERDDALKELAAAARWVDRSAFGKEEGFGQAHHRDRNIANTRTGRGISKPRRWPLCNQLAKPVMNCGSSALKRCEYRTKVYYRSVLADSISSFVQQSRLNRSQTFQIEHLVCDRIDQYLTKLEEKW